MSPRKPVDETESPGSIFPRAQLEGLERRFTGSKALNLAFSALWHGATVHGPGSFELDVSGDCESSVALFEHDIAHDWFSELRAEARARTVAREMVERLQSLGIGADIDDVVVRRKRIALSVRIQLFVRCRKCAHCLRHRSLRWTYRAIEEYRASRRTWFGTMTLRPGAHDHYARVAQARGDVRCNDFDALTQDEKFIARHLAISSEITLWLKRIRKNSGAVLRYLVVTEAHSSGLPHYHALIHEYDGHVQERQLSASWRVGFSQWRLVASEAAARYVCKYLSKNPLARVRASGGYGNVPETELGFQRVPSLGDIPKLTTNVFSSSNKEEKISGQRSGGQSEMTVANEN